MSTFLALLGGFVLFVMGVVLLFCMWCLACACAEWAMKRFFWKMDSAFRHEFAGRLMRASWWFSEDEKTMRALQLYAESISTGTTDPSAIRDKWRSEFETKEKA